MDGQKPEPDAGPRRRVLVVANETVAGLELLAKIRERAGGQGSEVMVVCPAINSRLRHWISDSDRARAEAQRRLDVSLAALRAHGINARGQVGDGDPLQAIDDALCVFSADELIISTHPPGRSNWLEKRVVSRALVRCSLPIMHVIVDLQREQELRSTSEVAQPQPSQAPAVLE
jgi:hypothetical protein